MIKIGSARIDENGCISGGRAGDQTGREVCEEPFYVHQYGWNVLRCTNDIVRKHLADCMKQACKNNNIGYDQNQRLGVISKGIWTDEPTECDCSSLVRACLLECGIEIANFTTYNEKKLVMDTGMFQCFEYINGMDLCMGDILVSKKKGHTAIVTEGVDYTDDWEDTGEVYDIDDLAKRCIRGEFGNGATRKQKLERMQKGLYKKVQARINEIFRGL